MKRLVFLLCFFAIAINLYSESVYTLDLKKDLFISALAIGAFVSPQLIKEKRDDPPSSLDRSDVNFFDRGLMYSNNNAFDRAFSFTKLGYLTIPIITPIAVAGWDIRKDFDTWLTYGVMYMQTFYFTYGLVHVMKDTIYRYRPRAYFSDNITLGDSSSFPSGSTAIVFMPATFLSVTFAAEFPDSPWKIPIIIGSHTLAAAVGAARISSGYHFLSDVLAGAAIGSFFGWVIPTLHRRTNNTNNLSFYFTGNGALVSLRF